MTDPTGSLVENLAYWIFKALPACQVPDYSEALSVRCPVSPIDVLDDRARRSSGERNLAESTSERQHEVRFRRLQHSHFARGGNCK
jgi:hypothetical protein